MTKRCIRCKKVELGGSSVVAFGCSVVPERGSVRAFEVLGEKPRDGSKPIAYRFVVRVDSVDVLGKNPLDMEIDVKGRLVRTGVSS